MRDPLVFSAVGLSSLGLFLHSIPLTFAGILLFSSSLRKYTSVSRIFEESIYSPKFQRRTAWFLLAIFLLEGLTGFGAGPVTSSFVTAITFGLLTRGLSLTLHFGLVIPLTFFFVLHAGSGIGLALYRRGIRWVPLYTAIIPILLILLFAVTAYLDSLYFFG